MIKSLIDEESAEESKYYRFDDPARTAYVVAGLLLDRSSEKYNSVERWCRILRMGLCLGCG
jgi:hypothetical protein